MKTQTRTTSSEPVAQPAPPKPRTTAATLLGLDRFSGIWLFAIVVVVFGLWTPHSFLTITNLHTLLSEQAINAMIAVGLLIPLAGGVYDLSIGSIMGFAVVLVTHFQSVNHLNAILACLLTLVISIAIGGVNALVVTRFRVNSFIATLAMSSVLTGLITAVSNNTTVVSGLSNDFLKTGQNSLFGIGLPFYYMILMALVVWYFLERTPTGRYLYAFGSNPEATRLAGIRSPRLVAGSLLTSATIGGLAGIVLAARLGAGSLDVGSDYLLPGFAAAFLGSTQIRVGRVNVLGTLVAIALLATGVKGLQLVGVPLWVNDVFNGAALLLAVGISAMRSKSRWRATS